MVSKRVSPILSADKELVARYFQCKQSPYHAEHNPDGYINFGTAENYLLWDLITEKTKHISGLTEADSHYAELHGKRSFRQQIANLFSSRAGVNISEDDIVTAAGTTAILEILAYCLCDPDDAILVPTPYYSGFDYAFNMRAGAKLLPIPCDISNQFSVSIESIKTTLDEARKQSINVRAMLTSSPRNPIGDTLSKNELQALVQFCETEGLELIIDEIFADTRISDEPFVSAMSTDANHVHTVYGFAKDFALSGLAVGVLHSKNQELIEAAQELAHFSRVSNHTQSLVEHVLSDEKWLEQFFQQAKLRLTDAYNAITNDLQEADIPYMEAKGGVFVFVNLSEYLDNDSFEAEKALSDKIFNDCKINLSPGALFHCPQPGWFRITYTLDREQVKTGITRLVKGLKAQV